MWRHPFIILWGFLTFSQWLAWQVTLYIGANITYFSPVVDKIIAVPAFLICIVAGFMLVPVSFPVSMLIKDYYKNPLLLYLIIPLLGAALWTFLIGTVWPYFRAKWRASREG